MTSIETSFHPLAGAFTCAIEDADGDGVGPAYCWGYNGSLSLWLGGKKRGSKSEPSDPVGGGSLLFSHVQLGQLFARGIEEDGDGDGEGPLYCWGQNDHGELADGTHGDPVRPGSGGVRSQVLRPGPGKLQGLCPGGGPARAG